MATDPATVRAAAARAVELARDGFEVGPAVAIACSEHGIEDGREVLETLRAQVDAERKLRAMLGY